MGLTAGSGGGRVLEVSWLTGDTVDFSIHNFICDLNFCARPAEYKPLLLTVHALIVQIHTGHPRLAAALRFPIAGAGGNLLEAQHRVTGAAQLAGEEMVPVFVVGIMEAGLANRVLAGAADSMDKLAWGTAGAADLMQGLVVFLVRVPASLVFYAIWGHLERMNPWALCGRDQAPPAGLVSQEF